MWLVVTKSLRKGQAVRVVFVAFTLLFLLIFVCIVTSSYPFSFKSDSERSKRKPDLPIQTFKKLVPKCPSYPWNSVQTDDIPHIPINKTANWPENNLKMYRLAPIGAFLFEKFILVMVEGEKMAGRPVICRYFDCLRREIPNQFESRIYPESVVYCPRRVGALFISVSGNAEEKPDEPIPVEIRFKSSPTSTTVEAQIVHSK